MENSCVVCDCDYNIMNQLVRLNKFLWVVDSLIEDAKKADHAECAAALEEMKKDAVKNSDALKKLIKNRAKSDDF